MLGGGTVIRIAICDDSPTFLQQTKSMIDQWNISAIQNITTELFEDGDALLSAHARMPFDIVLLDIVMPLLNGLDTARELRQKDKNVKIIFLTSSAEFALESYTVKASNYLLKPLDSNRFFACLDDVVAEVHDNTKCIIVKGLDATHRIPISDINYIESQLKHIIFFLTDHRTITSLDPFYVYEDLLTLDDGFFKCHRSYIVNIHHIDNYSHAEIVMRSGQHIPISRSFQKSFEPAYFRVIFGKAGDEI